jgi:uncharacterized repeat protein (TIGR03803 family)
LGCRPYRAALAGCSLGTVFEITAGGRLTNLHSFDGTHGNDPTAGLVQGADGNFYGTTYTGGTNYNGTVFKITPAGSLMTLHRFVGTDGANPWAGLVQATDGNFYGTTSGGGAHDGGTIFKITPAGKLSTVYNFCSQPNCTDGDDPLAGWCKPPMGSSMAQQIMVEMAPIARARFFESRQVAR